MPSKVRIGIIGMGAIASVHADALKKLPDADLAACADANPEQLRANAAPRQISRQFQDYRELLAQKEIDAVYICVPNYLHSPVALDALKAGKHVFCEKPMALNAKLARQMTETARAQRRVLQVGMVSRQRAQAQVVRDYVERGLLGPIYHMRAVLRRRRGVPGLGGWFTTKAQSGGGALIDIGVHFFDLLMWLSDNWEPTRVSAATYNRFGGRMKGYTYVNMWAGPPRYDGVCDVDDYAAGVARFKSGASFSFEISWAGNNPPENFIELLGDKGGVRVSDGTSVTLYTEQEGRLVDVVPQFADVNMFDIQAQKFVAAVQGKQAPAATGDQGLAVMRLIDAVYKSSREGKEVAVAEE